MKEYSVEFLTHSQFLSLLKDLPPSDWKLVSHTYMANVNMFHIVLERDISCDISESKIDTPPTE